jgi:hypothetical protein
VSTGCSTSSASNDDDDDDLSDIDDDKEIPSTTSDIESASSYGIGHFDPDFNL